MAFGYHFTNPTEVEKLRRRELLTLYPLVAQLSVLGLIVSLKVYFLASWLTRKCVNGDEESRPNSPNLKYIQSVGKPNAVARARKWLRKWSWWLGESLHMAGRDVGTSGEWVGGGIWMLWLLTLCIRRTGDDYLHLTKRLGIIGASQLPLQYFLAMKSPYSPLQVFTRCSHEQLNKAHQVLGRIVQTLFTLHAALYLNFYIMNNLLAKRVQDVDVIIGVTGILLFTLIGTSALGYVRRWNYRVFYTTHIAVATGFLPLMYFHVVYIRPYILESVCVYVAHVLLRYFGTRAYAGTITVVPSTNLIRVVVPSTTATSKWKPGQHVYLRLPTASYLRSNPFTIASLPNVDGNVTLIARALRGNTAQLASLARSTKSTNTNGIDDSDDKPAPLRLTLEGPYGTSAHLPDFSRFDRVLLIAGGVGATFIVPVWRHILRLREKTTSSPDVRFAWAVRNLAETSWAFPLPEAASRVAAVDDEAEIYVSGIPPANYDEDNHANQIELVERGQVSKRHVPAEKDLADAGVTLRYSRPVLRELVDQAFTGHVERVAVLVCGPPGMGQQGRRDVGRWVRKGKEVFWHNEAFGL